MIIPGQLIANCRRIPEREAWLDSLPAMLEELTDRCANDEKDRDLSAMPSGPVLR